MAQGAPTHMETLAEVRRIPKGDSHRWTDDERNAAVDAVCKRIEHGDTLLQSLDAEGVILSTWWRWCDKYEHIRNDYARARKRLAELWAAEIVSIADEATNENAQAVRVRVDARKWVIAKVLPHTYGDAIRHEHTGPGGGPITLAGIPPTMADAAQRSPRVQAALEELGRAYAELEQQERKSLPDKG